MYKVMKKYTSTLGSVYPDGHQGTVQYEIVRRNEKPNDRGVGSYRKGWEGTEGPFQDKEEVQTSQQWKRHFRRD